MTSNHPGTYIIRGGEKGRARLKVLSRILAGSTGRLLDRAGSLEGARIVDLGCGGGDVTMELARRAGPRGWVWGLDLDAKVLELAEAEARQAGVANVTFAEVDIGGGWPVDKVSAIYARFILTHVPEPEAVIKRAASALASGGTIIVEDIDMEGRFWDPASPALSRLTDFYTRAAKMRGGDPTIGRKLTRLLDDAGFAIAHSALAQPFGRDGDVKQLAMLDFANIADSIVALGLLERLEADALADEVNAFAERSDTTISLPRVFQAVGRKK